MMVKFEIRIPEELVEDYRDAISLEDKAKADSIRDTHIIGLIHDCFVGNQDYIDSHICVYFSPSDYAQGIAVDLPACQNKSEICDKLVSTFNDTIHHIIDMMDVVNKAKQKQGGDSNE